MYIQLNETKAIFSCSAQGVIHTDVEVPLAVILAGKAALEDYINRKVVGAAALEDLHYRLIRAEGQAVVFGVTGSVAHLPHTKLDATTYAKLPLVTYRMDVARVGYGVRTVLVDARSWTEAYNRAIDEACNTLFSEHASDYVVQGGSEVAVG